MDHRLFLALPFVLAACSGGHTEGQAGHLAFGVVSSMCTLGCSLDSPFLEGSPITIRVGGGDPKTIYTLRLNPPSLGTFDGSVMETRTSGDGRIEAFDGRGNLYDAVAITVAKADHIESTVTVNNHPATAAADGSYAVHVGDALQVHSVVTVGGKALLFTEQGLFPRYSDPTIVGAENMDFGATDVEYALAKNPGTATTTMIAHGAQSVVTFHVE